jgi:hypothetical protein
MHGARRPARGPNRAVRGRGGLVTAACVFGPGPMRGAAVSRHQRPERRHLEDEPGSHPESQMPADGGHSLVDSLADGRIPKQLVSSLGNNLHDGSPSSPSEATATIRLTTAGLVPAEVRIPVGGKVLFVEVGSIAPGQSRSTGALTVARSCGFHDHLTEFDDMWKGRIIVQ